MKKELIQIIYGDACAKGFHTEYKSDQHWLIMVITEVAEAIEADRQNRYVKLNPTIKAVFKDVTLSDEAFIDRFQQYIKNHVEDELADIVIRLCDYAGDKGFFDLPDPTIKADKMFFASLSFTEVAYDLTKHIIVDEAFLGAMEAFLPNIIQYVYDWADSMGIDLDWFVEQKIRYNSLREPLHNKKY